MPDILLTTLNAKYSHASFGLRYLMANLGELKDRAEIIEFDINQDLSIVAERILAKAPKIIGFGVYIWNVRQTRDLLTTIKRVRPDIVVILGGPEVSFETEDQEIIEWANYVVRGEADLKFAEICSGILNGSIPSEKVIRAAVPELDKIIFPYELYSDRDIQGRVVYVEASRGCPFTCEFCLSSLDIPVRQFNLDAFLGQIARLYERGLRQFKFVDRTFNLNIRTGQAILNFFLERYTPELFVHFEMIPDRLPEQLRTIIAKFPAGAIQFEVGIQTFNPEVGKLISRRQDYQKLADNFRFLRQQTGVHIHADLIIGLPGESVESFASGFNRLVELNPQEIQVGILKKLRGTPIGRHDQSWEMRYSPNAPYEILQSNLIDFPTMQRLKRFARYWDLVANSGKFVETTPLLWEHTRDPFNGFLKWSDWLFDRAGSRYGIAFNRLIEFLWSYLTQELKLSEDKVHDALSADFQRIGRSDLSAILKPTLNPEVSRNRLARTPPLRTPHRQLRHRV